jgi:PIN domain nuclease of toxin-antitoxin system
MAIALLADTQVLIWYVREPNRLSRTALDALETAIENGDAIGVSAFSIVEIVYATEKATNPLTLDDLAAIRSVLADSASPFEVLALDEESAAHVHAVPRSADADPGDRIIVATAEVLGVPIVSSDSKFPSMTSQVIIW